MTTYYEYSKISRESTDMATLSLDVVLFDDETPEDAAKALAKNVTLVTWEIKPSGNCWPQIDFTGPTRQLFRIRHAYKCQGNSGRKKGSKNKKGPFGEKDLEQRFNAWWENDGKDTKSEQEDLDKLKNFALRGDGALICFDQFGYFIIKGTGPGPNPERQAKRCRTFTRHSTPTSAMMRAW